MNKINNHIDLPNHAHHSSLFCWSSIISGLFVAVLFYMLLSALGIGIWGFTAEHVLAKNENGTGLATGAALWLGLSTAVSLFLGSFFATRYSNATHKFVGSAQGLIIAAIFFFLLLQGFSAVIGNLSAFTSGLVISPDADSQESARMLGETGWVLFAILGVGIVSAVFGGREGALGNQRRPFARIELRT